MQVILLVRITMCVFNTCTIFKFQYITIYTFNAKLLTYLYIHTYIFCMSHKPQKDPSMAFTLFIFIALLKLTTADTIHNHTNLFKAILVFGDSTQDSGNNNYISTTLKADHQLYGQDFPGRVPTGRFSNGKLVPDFWASLLGIKETIPPYLKPNLSRHDLMTGVNFASVGSGYDDITSGVSQVISMSTQLTYFRKYVKKLKKVVGVEEAKSILSGSLVSISAGGNDFLISFYDLRTRRDDFAVGD